MSGTLRLTIAVGILLAAGGARAQEPLDPMRLDPSLRGLTFGWSKEQVVSWLKARVGGDYEARIRGTADVRDKDALSREAARRTESIGTQWAAFDGTRSGWDASVIKAEFAHGTLEELLHEREGDTNLYFFFTKGVLYKLVRTTAAKPADVLAELERTYGAAPTRDPAAPKPGEEVRSAAWNGGLLRLAVDDHWGTYRCATVRWTLAAAEDGLKAERDRAGGKAAGMNPLVDQSKAQAPDEADPVDSMIGGTPKPLPHQQKPPKGKKRK